MAVPVVVPAVIPVVIPALVPAIPSVAITEDAVEQTLRVATRVTAGAPVAAVAPFARVSLAVAATATGRIFAPVMATLIAVPKRRILARGRLAARRARMHALELDWPTRYL